MQTIAEKITEFYKNLDPSFPMAEGVAVMNPFKDEKAFAISRSFYEKFYSDSDSRVLIFGINPGRFGGGVTGIPFTDPIRLADDCGIQTDLARKPELSSVFVYDFIRAFGGPELFYRKFLVTALSPLGFTKNGLNLNYYDDPSLLKSSESFILRCIEEQKRIVQSGDTCFCLGEGTNYKIFSKWNNQHGFFNNIIPLPHPRWIMQYRRKKLDEFVRLYLEKLMDA